MPKSAHTHGTPLIAVKYVREPDFVHALYPSPSGAPGAVFRVQRTDGSGRSVYKKLKYARETVRNFELQMARGAAVLVSRDNTRLYAVLGQP